MNQLMSPAPGLPASPQMPPNSTGQAQGQLMGNGPPVAPPGPANGIPPQMPPPPSPEEIKTLRQHVGAVVDGLRSLAAKPRGDLTKKDVFDAASEMIAKGAFPTPEAKQGLIGELAKLPDDEADLRKAIGGLLLQTSATQQAFHAMHGAK